ncbi:carbohydrate ABC transporter permease [Saccharopolyspora sp. 5N708]|uniref:carbohydrate ABC transporter permease n=1 Tax=Saccharopolyspora sp. 5N708 TaxID=3457424 RepID=UPI003FD081F2
MIKPGGRRYRASSHAVLVLACLGLLLPLLWALISSFKPASDLYGASVLPLPASLENYQVATQEFPLFRLLLNTLVTAAGVSVGHLVIAVLAAYAMIRFRFRGQRLLLVLVTIALLIPAQALIIPQFLLVSRLGRLDTYAGLIIPQLGGCALAVLLLRQNFHTIPEEMFSAAQLDGSNSIQTLWHVVLPLSRPALGAVTILSFINTWNEYLWPMLIAPTPEHATIQMGLTLFTNTEGSNPGPLLAAATLSTVPVLAVYVFTARHITHAFLHSGLR